MCTFSLEHKCNIFTAFYAVVFATMKGNADWGVNYTGQWLFNTAEMQSDMQKHIIALDVSIVSQMDRRWDDLKARRGSLAYSVHGRQVEA